MRRISEIKLGSEADPGHETWLSIIESLEIPYNGVDISSYLSIVTSQSSSDITTHIRGLGYDMKAITTKQLLPLIECDVMSSKVLHTNESYTTTCFLKNTLTFQHIRNLEVNSAHV